MLVQICNSILLFGLHAQIKNKFHKKSRKGNMAEETKKTTKTEKQKKERSARTWSSTKILDCVAYFAIIFIAVALIFRLAFRNNTPDVAKAFASIGECLAYVICIWLGFYWTMRTRKGRWTKQTIWWLVGWIVATVVIVIVYIFAII